VLFKNEALKGDEYFLHVGMYFFLGLPRNEKHGIFVFNKNIINKQLHICMSVQFFHSSNKNVIVFDKKFRRYLKVLNKCLSPV
jgi:hypothetical protein